MINHKKIVIRDFIVLLELSLGSVATNAPIRNSHAREVGKKNEAVGKICVVTIEAAKRIGIAI